MVRVPLEELVLQIHMLGMGPAATFLEKVIEPPPARSIQAAVAHLQALKALSSAEHLTPLGTSLQSGLGESSTSSIGSSHR
jgi:ATP-dependent RNA helicase DHX29